MSDVPVDLKSNTNYVLLKNLQDEPVVPRTSLAAVDLVAGNGMRVAGSTIYTADASAYDIIYGTSGSGVITPAGLKAAMDEGFLAAPDIATVDEILSGSTGQMVDPNGLNSALKVAQAVDVSTLGATTMDGDVSVLNYLDTFTLVGTWDSTQDPNVWVTNKYGFGINDTGDYDPTKYPKYAAGLRYIFIMDIKLVSGQFASILAMNNGRRQNLLIDGGSLSDYDWHRYAFEFDSNAAYFIINITKNSSVQLKNVRQYEVTALTDDAIKALAGFEDPDDFEYSHIIDQNMINPWLQIIDMGSSPEVLVYPGLSYRINAQNNNVKLHVPSMPANKSGLDSYVELYVGGEGSVVVQRPLVLGATITPYSTNQCTVKFRDGRAVLTIDEVSQDYVVTVASGVEGDALEGSLYYGLVNATANQIAFNSGLDGQEIAIPNGTTITTARAIDVVGNGRANTLIGGWTNSILRSSTAYNVYPPNPLNLRSLTITGCSNSSAYIYFGNLEDCMLTDNSSDFIMLATGCTVSNCLITRNSPINNSGCVYSAGGCLITGSTITDNNSTYSFTAFASNNQRVINSVLDSINIQSGTVSITGSSISDISLLNMHSALSVAVLSEAISISGKITGSGLTTLTANSVLDLSNNTHAAVASGGTVSAAAGAKIIALGGNTVTISANTSGSYLLNNGTITSDVYIVTTSGSSTGSGSLIYGMTASSAGNILFDSGVDGQTVTLPEGSTNSRLVHIIGNGADQTILGGSSLLQTNNPLYLSGMCIKTGVNSNVAAAPINLTNCKATGYTNASSPIFTVYPAATKPTNCEIYSNICLNVGYGGPYIGCNIHDNTIYKHIMLNSVARDCQFVNNVYAGSDVSSVQSGACMANYATNVYIMNCYFNNPQMYYAFRTDYNTRAGEVLILGSTFASNGDALYSTAAGAKYIFADTNVFNSYLQCVTAVVNLVTGSTLDLSANTNSVVVYGSNPTTAAITGTTINVVASTASDAAIGGTATILYNDNGVTKSRTLSGGGAGYIMRNNGSIGVPVTVASGTASGSLYEKLTDTSIKDITFAPVIDGSTIDALAYGGSDTGLFQDHSYNINGAGWTNTFLKYRFGNSDPNAPFAVTISCLNLIVAQPLGSFWNMTTFDNCEIHTSMQLSGHIIVKNCYCHNISAVNSLWRQSLGPSTADRGTIITGSTFAHVRVTNDTYESPNDGLYVSWPLFENTTFTDMNNIAMYRGTASISGCLFDNTGTAKAKFITGSGVQSSPGSAIITGSTFTNYDILTKSGSIVTFSGTNILNSTVSGAGTVAFADGATVTSTIPSGSTIGTGVISATIPSDVQTWGNVEISNITLSGQTFSNWGVGAGNNKTVKFTNVIITGWKFNTYSPGLFINGNGKLYLDAVAISGHDRFNTIYASGVGSIIRYKDSSTAPTIANAAVYRGTFIFDGNSDVWGLVAQDASLTTAGNYVFTPGSTTSVRSTVNTSRVWPEANTCHFYVGTVDDSTGEITTTGTATVILNGTTVNISGSGTILDTTGIHS